MGFYESRILPKLLDKAMSVRPIMRQRQKVVPLARGRVLEVGIGSGLNLSFYDRDKVERVLGLDPSPELQAMAKRRADEAGVEVDWLALSSEKIPLDDDSVDSIVITYTMCTIPDVHSALLEMRRVLKPEGRMHFSEHGLAPDASVRRWQERINPWWKRIAGGCNLNRSVTGMLDAAGFRLDDVGTIYLPGLRPLTFNTWGTATKA